MRSGCVHLYFLLFLFFGCTWGIWKFPSQGLNPSRRFCDPCHSSAAAFARSLTHCARLEIELATPESGCIVNPLCHSGNSPFILSAILLFCPHWGPLYFTDVTVETQRRLGTVQSTQDCIPGDGHWRAHHLMAESLGALPKGRNWCWLHCGAV